MIFTLKNNSILLSCFLSFFVCTNADNNMLHYYCTAADERHFILLVNLIGSIHKIDFDNLGQIAVFDLGLNQQQKDYLKKIRKLNVYIPEKTHPDILKYFLTSPHGRKVRGWFAWKPVVIKQALDMFPYVLYLDAGATILRSPKDLFRYIVQQGYFLMDTGPHAIEERSTQTVIDKLINPLSAKQKDFLLDSKTLMISPGLQGVSRKIYKDYVLPVYELTKDIDLFADDGTCRLGFGAARHDQPIFSIYAYLNDLKIHTEGWTQLEIEGEKIAHHIHWDCKHVNNQTTIYQSRWNYLYHGNKLEYIKFG